MKKGKIIVIEGSDCSGKETQAALLLHYLKSIGKRVEKFSFPMYDTPTGKIIGGPYLGKEYISNCYFKEGPVDVDPKVAALYYAADRKYNLKVIEDYLNAGYYVILDRYTESNMGHQGAKIYDKNERLKLYKWLETLEYELLELPHPDLTIFLHLPYQKIYKLKSSRDEKEDLVEENIKHLKNAEETYLELADIYGFKTIKCIENNKIKPVETINAEIIKIVDEFMEQENE